MQAQANLLVHGTQFHSFVLIWWCNVNVLLMRLGFFFVFDDFCTTLLWLSVLMIFYLFFFFSFLFCTFIFCSCYWYVISQIINMNHSTFINRLSFLLFRLLSHNYNEQKKGKKSPCSLIWFYLKYFFFLLQLFRFQEFHIFISHIKLCVCSFFISLDVYLSIVLLMKIFNNFSLLISVFVT